MTERERTHALLLCSMMLETLKKIDRDFDTARAVIESDIRACKHIIEEFHRSIAPPANENHHRGESHVDH